MIEPSLIGQKSRDQQRNADKRDRNLGNHLGFASVRGSHEASLTKLRTKTYLLLRLPCFSQVTGWNGNYIVDSLTRHHEVVREAHDSIKPGVERKRNPRIRLE